MSSATKNIKIKVTPDTSGAGMWVDFLFEADDFMGPNYVDKYFMYDPDITYRSSATDVTLDNATCKDPEAFDPSAQLEYRCQKTGLVTKDECPAACIAHESYDAPHEFTCECTFYVSDSLTPKEECDTLLPGVSSWLHVCVIGRARAGE